MIVYTNPNQVTSITDVMPLPVAAQAAVQPKPLDPADMTVPNAPRDPGYSRALEAEVVAIVESKPDVGLAQSPRSAIVQAHVAAKALQEIINSRIAKVVINGKQYLTFEDWQTVGNFYGITAKVCATEPIYVDQGQTRGWKARAIAVNRHGVEVGGAEAVCLDDEPKWASKPFYSLLGMAQTRACSRALRQILAFVPVLAGFSPAPAEEMEGIDETAIAD